MAQVDGFNYQNWPTLATGGPIWPKITQKWSKNGEGDTLPSGKGGVLTVFLGDNS